MNTNINSNNLITIKNLSFSYDNKLLYDSLNLSFKVGEASVIMSASGIGKTTLFYIMAGLLKPEKGTITFPIENPRFSMVFQDSRLVESANAINNIKLVNSNLTENEIMECLASLGIDKPAHNKVSTLSGGEKQRVAIARALLAEYDILLLDEPFNGLDDETKTKVITYIKNKTAHKTVLLVTHHLSEATLFSDNIIKLD